MTAERLATLVKLRTFMADMAVRARELREKEGDSPEAAVEADIADAVARRASAAYVATIEREAIGL